MFYWLEATPKRSSLERYPKLKRKKRKKTEFNKRGEQGKIWEKLQLHWPFVAYDYNKLVDVSRDTHVHY